MARNANMHAMSKNQNDEFLYYYYNNDELIHYLKKTEKFLKNNQSTKNITSAYFDNKRLITVTENVDFEILMLIGAIIMLGVPILIGLLIEFIRKKKGRLEL